MGATDNRVNGDVASGAGAKFGDLEFELSEVGLLALKVARVGGGDFNHVGSDSPQAGEAVVKDPADEDGEDERAAEGEEAEPEQEPAVDLGGSEEGAGGGVDGLAGEEVALDKALAKGPGEHEQKKDCQHRQAGADLSPAGMPAEKMTAGESGETGSEDHDRGQGPGGVERGPEITGRGAEADDGGDGEDECPDNRGDVESGQQANEDAGAGRGRQQRAVDMGSGPETAQEEVDHRADLRQGAAGARRGGRMAGTGQPAGVRSRWSVSST